MTTLDKGQVAKLLATAKGHRIEALYVLAVTTGMREGELLELHWSDADLDTAIAHVVGSLQRTPDNRLEINERKTDSSRRQVTLSQTALTALRRHRSAQAEERLWLGEAWDDHDLLFSNGVLLFPNGVGRPLNPTNLLQRH
jgi:integrase